VSEVSAESVLVAWLSSAFPDVRVVTETPANLADVVPLIRVSRFGGVDEQIWTFDNPTMDFDCYDTGRIAARDLAYQVRRSLRRDLPGQIVAGAFVLSCRTLSGPAWTPYDNTTSDLRRFTYSAELRLQEMP